MEDNAICNICAEKSSKYTCPKCNIMYCSLSCYQSQKHIQCSETFYKDCVMTELNTNETDEASRIKMLEILKKFNSEQNTDIEQIDSDDEGSLDLEERLENIDLNNVGKVWEALTSDEKQEFEALVQSGDVTKLVPLWSPWWNFKVKNELVKDLSKEQVNYKGNCPKLLLNIKQFKQLSSKTPATCVEYNLINVIATYTCIVRYFNGDHFDFPKESVFLLQDLSKNLANNQNFESFSLAVESVNHHCIASEWISADSNMLYDDVKNILEGPENNDKTYYVKCALSDVYRLLQCAKKDSVENVKNEFSKKFVDILISADKQVTKTNIKMFERKIDYLLSFVNDYGYEIFN